MSSHSLERIKVFARIRPSEKDGEQKIIKVLGNDRIVSLNDDSNSFHFDGVFGEDSSQEEVFNGAASQIIQGALQGYNGTIFAYGQTGSGKSYSMIGNCSIFDETSGIIPRGLRSIFDLLEKKKGQMHSTYSFKISISFVEIYNEWIYDLFEMSQDKLKIGQDGDGNAMVKGASEKIVKDLSDAMEEVKRGWECRKAAETAMNRSSSRSHALLLIKIYTEEVHGSIVTTRSASLNLVDLAGSERISQSKVEGDRSKETGSINVSLLTLKRVIRQLSEKKEFISFRDNPLTHILKDSIGGNARTAVLININPMFYSETISSLQFASEVGRVENKVVVNEDLKGNSVAGFEAEIRRLREEMEKIQSTNSEESAVKQKELKKWKDAAKNYKKQLDADRRSVVIFEKDELLIQLEEERRGKEELKVKLMEAVKSSEEKKDEAVQLAYELCHEVEKSIGEMREKIDRMNSDFDLLQSTHIDRLKELEINYKSELSEKEKKIESLTSQMEDMRLAMVVQRREWEDEREKRAEVEMGEMVDDFHPLNNDENEFMEDSDEEVEESEEESSSDTGDEEVPQKVIAPRSQPKSKSVHFLKKEPMESVSGEDSDEEVEGSEDESSSDTGDKEVAQKKPSNKGNSQSKSVKKRRVMYVNNTDLECPKCEYRTRSANTWTKHLKYKHFTTPAQADLALRCECSQESFSVNLHIRKCKIANFTVIRKEKKTPQCVLCDKYPATVCGYLEHLRRNHKNKTTLKRNGIYLTCPCGVNMKNDVDYCNHKKMNKECKGSPFTLHKLDEE